MSNHHLLSNKKFRNGDEESYRNLDEDRKQQILKDLQDEMDKLKVKYMLDEKQRKFQKVLGSGIRELDTMTNRNTKGEKIEKENYKECFIEDVEENNFRECEQEEPEEDYNCYHKNINEENYNYNNNEYNDLKEDRNNQNINNLDNSDKYNETQLISNHELQSSQRSNLIRNSNSNNTSNYEMFDKAKENLLRIKNELDDMDQYDYRNRPLISNNSVLTNTQRKNNDYDLDDYLEEEEKPKNLEEEISMSMTMSMSKSLQEDSQHLNDSTSQYKFNTPYVSHLSHVQASTRDQNEIKRQKNNYMPTPVSMSQKSILKNTTEIIDMPADLSNLNKTNQTNPSYVTNSSARGRANSNINNQAIKQSKQKFMSNEKSSSASKEKDRKNSPYFKKMIKEYNPKYKRDKSKEKLQKIKDEVQEKFDTEHTFKPNINYANVFTNYDKYNESKEDLYKRLSTPKIVELNKRLKEKELEDNKKISEECTFKPILKANILDNEEIMNNKEKVENRLYKLAEQMKEKREKLKREYQDNIIKDYSFAPNIDMNSKQLMLKYETHRPIHQRYDEVVKIKKENLQFMRQNLEKEEKSSYKPEINPKSKEIIMRRAGRSFNGDINISAHERLYREGVNKTKNRNINKSNLEDEQECTFSPQLFYSTTQPSGNIDDFLERQKIYSEIKKERLERKLSKSIDNNQYTFTPKINLTSDILMKADHSRANEDLKDKVGRMYKDDFEKLKSRKEQLEKFYYAQYDFKPKINEISRFVGRDHTLEDLHTKKESDQVRRIKEEITNTADGCTFKPKINKNVYDNVQSNYKSDENILQRIHSEFNQFNRMMEDREMLECKFHPDIKREIPNYETKEPIMMKGFAKHLDQMEKARKAKRDKEEREKEVFITGENWSKDNLITIPKPFKLSYNNSNIKSKKDEMSKKNKEIEMKECTFKPTTNES